MRKKSKTENAATKMQTPQSNRETSEKIKTAAEFARTLTRRLETEFPTIESKIKSYTRQDLENIANSPEQYQQQLVELSNYMYRHSGYFKRIADYFINMALYCWTVDTEVLDEAFYDIEPSELSKNFTSFAGAVSGLNIEKEMHDIFIRVFLEDACFAYFMETGAGTFLYYLPSNWCSLRKTYGGVNIYGVDPKAVPNDDIKKLPGEIRALLEQKTTAEDPYVYPPPDKCFCVKYNAHFTYLYPPLFDLLKNIIEIDDYKALSRTQTENENYNLLGFDIPVDEEGELLLTDEVVSAFIGMARKILPSSFGVIPSPMKMTPIQFGTGSASEQSKVADAVTNFYDESGVSKELMSAAGSGSQLKMSMESDAGAVYAVYRRIEKIVNLKMRLSNFVYPSYRFAFKLLDVTVHNQAEKVNAELKLSQASIPNKLKLLGMNGVNPSKLLGSGHMENTVLNLGADWTVLKTSHTQSSDGEGRPSNESRGLDVSPATERGNDTDSNNPDNRV